MRDFKILHEGVFRYSICVYYATLPLGERAEISQRAVHQDQPDREERLDRDFKIAMTEEFESEVGKMCNLSDAIELRNWRFSVEWKREWKRECSRECSRGRNCLRS